MAFLRLAKTEEELKSMRIGDIKKDYLDIGEKYNQMIDGDLLKCPKCGDIMRGDTAFYLDKNYATNRYPICKRCLMAMVEQRTKKNDEPNETKESVQKVLQMMDRIYDDKFYEECVKGASDGVKEKNRSSPFATYFTAIASLPQWRGKTWKDSDFGSAAVSLDENETRIIKKTIANARKRFGNGYSDEDYMLLENEYQDWVTRHECNTKAQEEVFENLALIKYLKKKALLEGKPTKDLDKQQQDWLDSGNLKPKQKTENGLNDTLTFSQMLEKWEEHDPVALPDDEFKDVDGIMKYLKIWFGWIAKAVGLNNVYTQQYEDAVNAFSVVKSEEEAENNEDMYNFIFGSDK